MIKVAIALICALIAQCAFSAHLVSDPTTDSRPTHCRIYRNAQNIGLFAVSTDNSGGKYCNVDLSSWPNGTYTVSATFAAVSGNEVTDESALSDSITFTLPSASTTIHLPLTY